MGLGALSPLASLDATTKRRRPGTYSSSPAYAAARKQKGDRAGRTATARMPHAQVADGEGEGEALSGQPLQKAAEGRIIRSPLADGVALGTLGH
ncbi:hypothetical protein [Streptomyces colonosanans]|uniref:Uncharacterized protein n=1 Tax=Streptomyces colonosanans TaxID=1428652 RepID=A0A1S2NXB0_9ACTN|nr:hypothetical protein [Streptomyces colonosanans]OIJ86139.1 hypothetical protein BIV24_26830 [Streptomyces colonosanans]